MYFLKCDKCGYFNEVKTEYQTFCSNCSKKLTNSYSDWKVINPDGTFDEFKNTVCTTEIKIAEEKSKVKNEKTKGIKNLITIGFTFIIAFAFFYIVGKIGDEAIEKRLQPSIDKALMDMAKEYNESCPEMTDEGTRLDNVTAFPGNIIQFNFTLVNFEKSAIDFEAVKKNLEPNIIIYIKSSPEMKFIRENKTTVNYSYKDNTGKLLFTISIKPDQYR
jgi:hypothetical protein